MDNITLGDLWDNAIDGIVRESSTPDEIEKFKLFFYSGAYALINRNYHMQTNCESKEQYIEMMDALQQECIDIHKAAEPDKKPFLKLVVNNSCNGTD